MVMCWLSRYQWLESNHWHPSYQHTKYIYRFSLHFIQSCQSCLLPSLLTVHLNHTSLLPLSSATKGPPFPSQAANHVISFHCLFILGLDSGVNMSLSEGREKQWVRYMSVSGLGCLHKGLELLVMYKWVCLKEDKCACEKEDSQWVRNMSVS